MSIAEAFKEICNKWKTSTPLHLLNRVHSEEMFQNILRCERMRADRSGSAFAVVVFSFESINALSQFALYLQPRIRATDHIGLLGPERIGIVLWNTTHDGAAIFIDHVLQTWPGADDPKREIYLYPTHVAPEGNEQTKQDDVNDGSADGGIALQNHDQHNDSQSEKSQTKSKTVADVAGSSSSLDELSSSSSSSQKKTKSPDNLRPNVDLCRTQSLEILLSEHQPQIESGVVEDRIAQSLDYVDLLLEAEELNEISRRPEDQPVGQPLEKLFVQPLPMTKRMIDVVGASVGLLVLSPLLGLTALLVKWTSPGPVFFLQKRDGLGGVPFTIYKFRTMVTDAEAQKAALRGQSEQDGPAFKLEHDPRITPIGRFLRKSCIDELPQLWNVLKGDMTLVGPRPLDCKEAQHITGWGRRRLEITPGLTCIWQVHGKSRVSFSEWMRMDIRYMKVRTFYRDVKLVFETFIAVLLHRASH